MDKKRDLTIDIIKGIAIISVVLGHIWNKDNCSNEFLIQGRNIVYSYHIIAFVFCSGYLYKHLRFLKMIKKKIKTLYLPTVMCCFASYLFYPLLYRLGTLDKLTLKIVIKKILKSIVLMPDGVLVGALWFVPYLLITTLLFWIIISISNKSNKKYSWNFILSCVCGIIGILWITINPFENSIIIRILKHYYLPQALASVVFFAIGNYCKEKDIIKKVNKHIWIVSIILLLIINYIGHFSISIKDEEMGNGWFYLITIIGLAFIVSLSLELKDIPVINKTIVRIGRASFSIMAFHFICFKLIDGIMGCITNDKKNLKQFPVSFPNMWPVYLVFSVSIILGLRWLLKDKIFKIGKSI